ncbi:uncharacterized protein LOC133493836 isoform X2 [Syngnathoides biaculeatus]|uniref:uncharacterized protein LOC133493836 isoform X2 n=1 Tax=Syngnathoides biaculeatus TaxID=300417 RepID=UPI002ADD5648|nr:uncharacterized protein LOC133493836 isoform X2 [Syngnathoides biaculeatus]
MARKRINQELETGLRCLASRDQSTWSQHIKWVEYAHNSLPSASTGMAPLHGVHGYPPSLFPPLVTDSGPVGPGRGVTLQTDLGSSSEDTAAPTRPQRTAREGPSSEVWLSTKDLPLRTESRKLAPRSMKVHPTFHVSKLRLNRTSSLAPPVKPPRMVDGGPVYTVRWLLSSCRRGRGVKEEECSWIPSCFVVDRSLIRDFHAAHPDAPGLSRAGR